MASVSATALSWRPLPLRSSSSRPRAAEVRSVGVSDRSRCSPGTPRTCCWSSRSNSSDCFSSSSVSSSLCNLVLWNALRTSPLMEVRRLKYSTSSKSPEGRKMRNGRRGVVTTRAGMRLDPSGGPGNDNEGGIGRVIVNVALAGGVTYLAVTGKLGWVFDTLVSLWLLAVLIPIVSFVAFLWFAEREIVKGACPNCGQAFQVFEFAVKEQPNLCPYCSAPFKLDGERQFVRDEPRFSNERSGGFRDPFGGFRRDSSGPKKVEDDGGIIVDVEAKVVDRD